MCQVVIAPISEQLSHLSVELASIPTHLPLAALSVSLITIVIHQSLQNNKCLMKRNVLSVSFAQMVPLRNPTIESILANQATIARTLYQLPVALESGNLFMVLPLKISAKLSQLVTTVETIIKQHTSEMSVKKASTAMRDPPPQDNILVPQVYSDKSLRAQQRLIVVFVLLVSSAPL